ncbi:PREDICTED: uncharacterized protein LOC108374722 [Rhagoletis zephyria]|uniref:uncharacterized protein LOC108374722 n=1 Tax=Rhagoletis zephyria TaxID=28612 RepID=UPI00081189A3|nr:PREDICTED: uncharacterized protein LOC108374722 [Rhagoletis zephyria]
MKYSAFVIVVLCYLSVLSKAEQPYTVKMEDAEYFNGLTETLFNCEMKLVGRKRLLNGTMTFGEDMASDHFKYQIEIFNAPPGDNQFKRLPLGVPRTAICEGFKAYYGEFLQPSFIQEENTNLPSMPKEGLCPFPKGEYWCKNLLLNTDAWPNQLPRGGEYWCKNLLLSTDAWPNQLPRGLVKAVITFFKDEVDVGGGSITVRVEDRE